MELSFVAPNIYPTYAFDYVVSARRRQHHGQPRNVEFPTWIDQVFVNHDYDLTVVLHAEARDIGNYANPEYYWLYDSPEVQELLAQAKASPDPDEFVELRRQAAS